MSHEILKKELEKLYNEYDLFFFKKSNKNFKKHSKSSIDSHLKHLSEKINSIEKLLKY